MFVNFSKRESRIDTNFATDEIFQNIDTFAEQNIVEKSSKDIQTELLKLVEKLNIDKSLYEANLEAKNALADFKLHQRYGRQNGIHATPTVMVNGLIGKNNNNK